MRFGFVPRPLAFGAWRHGKRSVQPSQRAEEFFVFAARPHRYANGLGKTHPAHRADDHPLLRQFLAERFGIICEFRQNKIRDGRNAMDSDCLQSGGKLSEPILVRLGGPLHVRAGVERRQRRRLRDVRGIEWPPNLVHLIQQIRRSKSVPYPQTSQTIHLRKGAQYH